MLSMDPDSISCHHPPIHPASKLREGLRRDDKVLKQNKQTKKTKTDRRGGTGWGTVGGGNGGGSNGWIWIVNNNKKI